jgi:hypothetical protein
MRQNSKLLKTIAFFVALNIFGVYAGALFNFHMHHIFHKALLPQDMVCSPGKQKYIFTVAQHVDHDDGFTLPSHDGLIIDDLSHRLSLGNCLVRISLQPVEHPLASYSGYNQPHRAPPII